MFLLLVLGRVTDFLRLPGFWGESRMILFRFVWFAFKDSSWQFENNFSELNDFLCGFLMWCGTCHGMSKKDVMYFWYQSLLHWVRFCNHHCSSWKGDEIFWDSNHLTRHRMGPKHFDVSMLGLDTFYHKDGSWKNLAQDSQSSLAPGYIYIYTHICFGNPKNQTKCNIHVRGKS